VVSSHWPKLGPRIQSDRKSREEGGNKGNPRKKTDNMSETGGTSRCQLGPLPFSSPKSQDGSTRMIWGKAPTERCDDPGERRRKVD